MSSENDKRKISRVEFSRGIPVRIAGIDGTWTRNCLMRDASDQGAKLTLKQSVQGLALKEFFLILSTTGAPFRHCEVAWINGSEMGVRFVKTAAKEPARKPINPVDSNRP
ncbi:MAG: PilZ domain-containing protein [Bradyrhizobium sp.]